MLVRDGDGGELIEAHHAKLAIDHNDKAEFFRVAHMTVMDLGLGGVAVN